MPPAVVSTRLSSLFLSLSLLLFFLLLTTECRINGGTLGSFGAFIEAPEVTVWPGGKLLSTAEMPSTLSDKQMRPVVPMCLHCVSDWSTLNGQETLNNLQCE